MRRSSDRILAAHAGVLPRPDDLLELMMDEKTPVANLEERLRSAVAEVVTRQAEMGFLNVNDGEFSKTGGFSSYVRDRMTGITDRQLRPGEEPRTANKRDRRDFPGFYAAGLGQPRSARRLPSSSGSLNPHFCTGPVTYVGQASVQRDIDNLLAATKGLDVEPYLPAIAPGTIEHWLWNEHYATDEEFLFAIAEAMHEEYKAITDAGIVLQIDDPDLPDGWQAHPEMDVPTYHSYAQIRVEALNHALRGLPEELVRFHICWGSQHGPHLDDIPLAEIIDLVLSVHAECYSIEAANPTHTHEWRIWESVKLPEGKSLMPGVVGHASDLIEHPQLVAQRIIQYAGIVGKENVIAGTDCGLAARVGHPEICWAKLASLVKGAALATEELW
jgi:5-methyltetrahydropteroyltriglutamate--homocysteine methyltransferase